MKNLLFESKIAKIFYEEDLNLITLVWGGISNSVEYRDTFLKVLDYIEKNTIPKLLSDTSLSGTTHPDDRKWLETYVIPKAVKGGLKYTATILDPNVFKKYYLTQLKDSSEKSGMSGFQIFGSYDEGRKWILDQQI